MTDPRDRPLGEDDLAPDPLIVFRRWFDAAGAGGTLEPEAVALATATRDGRPSARMVSARGVDERGFAFYTNYILICRSMPDGFFRPVESQLRDLDRLATALASALRDPHTVLVASGDLTHYGLAFDFVPFTDDVNARIRAVDRPALEALQSLDVPRFLECMATRNWCGGPSFYVLMRIALLLGWAPRLSDYLVPAEEDWRPHGRTASFAAVTFLES